MLQGESFSFEGKTEFFQDVLLISGRLLIRNRRRFGVS
jgi:hypothetical protein